MSDSEHPQHDVIIVNGKTYNRQSPLGNNPVWGILCKATSSEDGTAVAVKKAFNELSGEYLKNEIRILKQLSHPCIANHIDSDTAIPILLTEFVDGSTLKDLLKSGSTYFSSEERVVRVALDVARGLQYVKEKKVVHRDMKTDNIMVTNFGRAKILDFGISRLLFDLQSTVYHAASQSDHVANRPVSYLEDIAKLGDILEEMTSKCITLDTMHDSLPNDNTINECFANGISHTKLIALFEHSNGLSVKAVLCNLVAYCKRARDVIAKQDHQMKPQLQMTTVGPNIDEVVLVLEYLDQRVKQNLMECPFPDGAIDPHDRDLIKMFPLKGSQSHQDLFDELCDLASQNTIPDDKLWIVWLISIHHTDPKKGMQDHVAKLFHMLRCNNTEIQRGCIMQLKMAGVAALKCMLECIRVSMPTAIDQIEARAFAEIVDHHLNHNFVQVLQEWLKDEPKYSWLFQDNNIKEMVITWAPYLVNTMLSDWLADVKSKDFDVAKAIGRLLDVTQFPAQLVLLEICTGHTSSLIASIFRSMKQICTDSDHAKLVETFVDVFYAGSDHPQHQCRMFCTALLLKCGYQEQKDKSYRVLLLDRLHGLLDSFPIHQDSQQQQQVKTLIHALCWAFVTDLEIANASGNTQYASEMAQCRNNFVAMVLNGIILKHTQFQDSVVQEVLQGVSAIARYCKVLYGNENDTTQTVINLQSAMKEIKVQRPVLVGLVDDILLDFPLSQPTTTQTPPGYKLPAKK